jgi:soluble lytic murein transglycosylase
MHEAFETAEEQQQARRLTYPLAYDRFVWDRAEENSIDPYLVLSLMRQESVYDPNALSRVGARGAMQIMPNTGHRIADLTLNVDYTAADLEDPIASIGYGVTYLARLMKRFDNAYPLAIASYNGGPHNVSAWLKGTTADMPMDAFVEHIPFKETRGYVQSVSSHYATYLSLYAPEGTELAIPPHPSGDHPEVVDF